MIQRVAVAVTTCPEPVRLVVWGATDADRRRALADARTHHLLYGRRIAAVEDAARPTPAAGDADAVASHADYDRTWAAYRCAGEDA